MRIASLVGAAVLSVAHGRVVNFHSAFHLQDVLRDTPYPQRAPTLLGFLNASDTQCLEKWGKLDFTTKGLPERRHLLVGRYDIEDQYHYAWFKFTERMDLPKRLEITKCPTLIVLDPAWTGRENNTLNHRVWDGTGDWRLWVRAQLRELPQPVEHPDWPQDRLTSRDQVESKTHLRISKVPAKLPQWSELGYKKVPMPDAIYDRFMAFYKKHESKRAAEYWDPASTQLNQHDIEMTMVKLDHDPVERDNIARELVRPVLSDWTGIPVNDLHLRAVYGIREYYRGHELRTHIDVIKTHVISAIINLEQEGMDEEWPLEVINHKGIRENITMEPREMILYESTTLPHGRPMALQGDAFRSVFVHFAPTGWDFEEDFDGIPVSPSNFMGYGTENKDADDHESPRATLTRAQFQNRSPRKLSLYWSGPDGPVLQSAVAANEELLVDTYEGHSFFWAMDSPNSAVGNEYKVTAAQEVYTHYGAEL